MKRTIIATISLILFCLFWLTVIICVSSVPNDNSDEVILEVSPTPTPTVITVEVEVIPDMEIISHDRIIPSNSQEALEQIENANNRKNKVQEILNNFAYLEYSDDRIITWADEMIINTNADIEYYTDIYNVLVEEEKWDARAEEYPTATYIWLFLKEQGFNDYVAAGIMGNMMTEAGGQSLSINASATSGSYYGICQWGPHFSGRYTDLDGQLNLLMDTIQAEFSGYGTMSYESFCNLENEQDAALTFAKSYERCTSTSYSQRQRNATKALEYFS